MQLNVIDLVPGEMETNKSRCRGFHDCIWCVILFRVWSLSQLTVLAAVFGEVDGSGGDEHEEKKQKQRLREEKSNNYCDRRAKMREKNRGSDVSRKKLLCRIQIRLRRRLNGHRRWCVYGGELLSMVVN
jgi:hypothetical protein